MTDSRRRRPSGTPEAGQFAATQHDEPDTTLDPRMASIRSGDNNDFVWRLPNGDLHRLDGPAWQWDGGVEAGGGEEHWVEGVLHRVDGPAWQWAGGVAVGGGEEWRFQGELHRLDGPAMQTRGGFAAGGSEEFWIDGVRAPSNQYEFLVACRGETRKIATPKKRPTGDPQSPKTVRPGV